MIDPGLVAIAIVLGLIIAVIWSWRSSKKATVLLDHTRAQPGRRLEGADYVGGSDGD